MKTILASLFVALVSVACGNSQGSRDFENINDPDYHPTPGPSKDVANSSAEKNKGTVDNVTISDAAATDDAQNCLLGCAIDESTAFNFNQSYDVTPAVCSAVKQVRIIPAKDDFTVLINAVCNDQNGIYAFKWSPATTTISGNLTRISQCDSSATEVSRLEVAEGNGVIAYNYQCSINAYAFAPRFGTFDISLSTLKNDVAISPLPSDRKYVLVWNPTTSEFGLFSTGRYMRFDSKAQQIGGTGTFSVGTIRDVKVMDGNWVVMANSSAGSPACTKISTMGSVLCNNKPISVSAVKFINSSTVLTGSPWVVSKASFDPATCQTSGENTDVTMISTAISPAVIYQTLEISAKIGAFVFHNGESLIIATHPLLATMSVYAESPIVSYDSAVATDTPKSFAHAGRLFVTQIVDAGAKIFVSDIR